MCLEGDFFLKDSSCVGSGHGASGIIAVYVSSSTGFICLKRQNFWITFAAVTEIIEYLSGHFERDVDGT
jgi:hypothetical protein